MMEENSQLSFDFANLKSHIDIEIAKLKEKLTEAENKNTLLTEDISKQNNTIAIDTLKDEIMNLKVDLKAGEVKIKEFESEIKQKEIELTNEKKRGEALKNQLERKVEVNSFNFIL